MSRLALYLGDSGQTSRRAELRRQFAAARGAGHEIVVVKREAANAKAGERPVFKRLVRRMESGEFEGIIGVVDADSDLPSLSSPNVGGKPTYRGRRS